MDTGSRPSGAPDLTTLRCGSSDKAVKAMTEAYDEMTKTIADTKSAAKVLSDLLQDADQDPVGTIQDMLSKTSQCFVECTAAVQALDNMIILPRMQQEDSAIRDMLMRAAPAFKRLVALNGDLKTFIVSRRIKKEQ